MLYETHALVPRLGLFEGTPHTIPYDYPELLASIAPRPVLLHSPQHDRFANHSAVEAAARTASKAWQKAGAAQAFIFSAPDAPSDFRDPEVGAALHWVETFVTKQQQQRRGGRV
jgi:hypothetical protein